MLDEDAVPIFISGYKEYMISLFRLDVYAFLPKPVDREEFIRAFHEVHAKIGKRNHYFRYRYNNVEYRVLCREIEEGKSEEAIHRMDEVIQRCNGQDRVVSSGNRVVDAVVNGKYMMAREQGICFKSRIYVAVDMPVASCDLGIILGNALDNAIEATERCTRNRKEIKISMGIKKEALVIVIENPYEHKLKKDRSGKLLSTREEKSGHGYGVQSIYRTAEKYEGEVWIEDEGERFRLSVILNLNLDAA